MTIELIMPVMRNKLAHIVIKQLHDQIKNISKLTIIDNGGSFNPPEVNPFEIELIKPSKNIGTNAAWNYMWETDCDYVGVIGDDYVFGPYLIQCLMNSFATNEVGGTTATIYKKRSVPPDNLALVNNPKIRKVAGKGHCGACIFKADVLKSLPKIPKELFIFFGDNWIGHWLEIKGYGLYETSTGIGHKYRDDLKKKLDYKKIISRERRIWSNWKKGKILLSNKSFS